LGGVRYEGNGFRLTTGAVTGGPDGPALWVSGTSHDQRAAPALAPGNESSSRGDVTDMTTDALRSRLDRTQAADARYAVKVQNGCVVRFGV
jgi:hypothetical protein